MARERIDDLTEAKQLRREYREQDVAYMVPDIDVVRAGPNGVTGTGMDGIEVDFAALRTAERDLAALRDELAGHLDEANELTGPLGDGTSPVTGPMRKAFHVRADDNGGVRGALRQYMGEIDAVRFAILKTLASYEGVESHTAGQLHQIEGNA
jgi:hypothetical protein